MRAGVGDWKHPDYAAVYRERTSRLRKLRDDPDKLSYLLDYYADGNVIDWIEDWAFTYDPRLVNAGKKPYVPFILFPRQRHFVAWLQDRFERNESGLADKSRDVGLSWLCIAFSLYLWTFVPGSSIGFGSQKLEKVDRLGDPKSLFEKIRLMLRMLPPEMQPPGYVEGEHARYMRIMNPSNGSIINGEGGHDIGRGDRSTLYCVDESAFIERADSVEASLSNTTDVRIDISTSNGTANPFYRRRTRWLEEAPHRVFTFHWTDDPRKGPEWYARKKEELEPEVLAREVDIDYEASAGDVAISPRWIQASRMLRRELERTGELPTGGEGVGGLDVGGGVAKSVFVSRRGPVVGKSKSWTDDDTTNTAGRARDLAQHAGCRVIKFDSIGVGKGVASSLKRLEIRAHAINVGNKPSSKTWPDGKTSRKKFTNLRAELWWTARDRLRKTYEHWLWTQGQGGQKHDVEELILLANDATLNSQLGLPRYRYTDSGKIQIERKTQMESRGIPSPDHADAFILTLAPAPARARYARTVGGW